MSQLNISLNDADIDPIYFVKAEPKMTTEKRTNNTYSHAMVYRLARWVELNQTSLKGKTQEKIAQEAGEGTGLKVTISNIRAVSETLGIPLGLIPNREPNMPQDVSRTLARALCDIYTRLGQEPPADVFFIADR